MFPEIRKPWGSAGRRKMLEFSLVSSVAEFRGRALRKCWLTRALTSGTDESQVESQLKDIAGR